MDNSFTVEQVTDDEPKQDDERTEDQVEDKAKDEREGEKEAPAEDDDRDEPPLEFIIRRARITDVVAIFKLLRRMHAESEAELPPVDERKAMATIVNLVAMRWVLIATTADGKKIAGSICVSQDTAWFTEQVNLIDMWWYVVPEYRSTDAPAALVREIIDLTQEFRTETGAQLRFANFATGERYARHMDVAVGNLGFSRVGGIYLFKE